jgi:hypothetical protein
MSTPDVTGADLFAPLRGSGNPELVPRSCPREAGSGRSGGTSKAQAEGQTISHVVNLSGGVCSFWCAQRVIERHGREGVALLFADVMMEDEDLYRFNRDAAEYLGVPITRISKEVTPWELFAKQGMIGNSRSPLCSVMLKREPLDEWHRAHTLELTTTLHIGIDWTEEHRLHDLRRRKPTWRIEAEMCEAPLWDKCKMLDELRAIGIEPPRLYKFGFPHNNCGGFCVKAGQAQFALLLRTMPERYAWHEAQEEKLRAQVGDFSVMTDRRGDGKKKPLPMRVLRERIEAGESFDRHDWGGCGCALDSDSSGGGGAELVGDSAATQHSGAGSQNDERIRGEADA